jgi:O-methyltransferase involved in polyketide biosynthesis
MLQTSEHELSSESDLVKSQTVRRYASKIGYSSQLTANLRAQESKRKDALFVDPFAQMLAGNIPANHANFVLRKYSSKSQGNWIHLQLLTMICLVVA